MDINEFKRVAENKIESESLTRQVRKQINETAWEKQNQREGFRESFKPLISQFEKHEDYDDPFKKEENKTKNIFTQNQGMLRNQLVLSEGVRDNQRAITDGFNQFERLANMRELPGVDDALERDDDEQPRRDVKVLNLERNFDGNDLNILRHAGYPRPNDFYEINIQNLEQVLEDVKGDIKTLTGQINGRRRQQNPTPEYVAETNRRKALKGTLMKYKIQ